MADKTLGEHISEMMDIVGYVQKDARNDFHRYKYASADAVLTRVRQELSARGIYIKRDIDRSGVQWTNVDDEGKINIIYDWAGWLVLGDKGIEIFGTAQGSDKTDKAAMKAQTAALKYALAGTFLISWGDDPEAEAHAKPAPSTTAPASKKKAAKSKARGVKKKAPVDIEAVVSKIRAAKSMDALEAVVTAAKSLEIEATDKPILNKAYVEKKEELEK